MDKQHLIFGILCILLVIIAFIVFIVSLFMIVKFSKLVMSGKILSSILFVISLIVMISGGYFAYNNFTYTAPKEDSLKKELKNTINNAKEDSKKYTQKITLEEYIDGDLDNLYNDYSEKGRADIDSTANGSEKTKELMLRNIGKKLEPGNNTVKLETIDGGQYSLIDGKNKLLVFADTSQYSINQLKLLQDYNSKNSKTPLDYVTIFPISSGTEVEEMYKANSSLGDMTKLNIVTKDSMPDNTQMDLVSLSTKEFSITDLPSYLAIDSKSVISNAGVGSIFDDQESLNRFILKSFSGKTKMYNEINKKTSDKTKTSEEK